MPTAMITGHKGFIGNAMFIELSMRGWDVWGYDIKDGHMDDFLDTVEDPWERLDLVVHCAYHVGGRAGIDGKNMNFFKNLELDSRMFEWAIRTKQKQVLYFSSSAAYPVSMQGYYDPFAGVVYEDAAQNQEKLCEDYITFDDSNPYGSLPDGSYGWAKLTGERLAREARRNGLPVTVVRPFSGYGEDQSLDYPFPSIVRRAQTGDLTVWGPPGQTRDFIHVSDVVKGALAVAEAQTEEPVNLCTGIPTEMGELARMAWDMVQNERNSDKNGGMDHADCSDCWVTYDQSKPTGVHYRVGDPTRMLQYYTPKVTVEEGVARYVRSLRG